MNPCRKPIPWLSLRSAIAAIGALGVLFLTASVSVTAFAAPGPCTGPPQDRPAECNEDPSPGGEVTFDLVYEFGELTGGVCSAPDCVSTSVTATGTVECGSNYCDFTSTSVNDFLGLPAGLRDLLFATKWRGTQIDPDQCFGSSAADPGSGLALIDSTRIFLRSFNDEETSWHASVDAVAWDVEGLELRDYGFHFQGCGQPTCSTSAPGSMAGVYDGGSLLRIDGQGNDRKFLSIPCRCTKSSTPGCPDDVPVPTPSIRITVSETP